MKRARLASLFLALLLLLTACTGGPRQTENWQVSPLFEVTVPGGERGQITYAMRGEEGQLGFIDAPFIAGKRNKSMWHLWGPPEQFTVFSRLKVIGVSQRGGQRITVLDTPLEGAHNTATAHTISQLSLPSPGLWRLEAYVDERFFGEIVVAVAPNA